MFAPTRKGKRAIGLATGLAIAAAVAVVSAVRDNTGTQVVDCGAFCVTLPRGWSIYKDLQTEIGVHLIKLEDEQNSLLNFYVYAKNSGMSSRQLMEFFGSQTVPLMEDQGVSVTVGEISEAIVYGRPGFTRPFEVTLNGTKVPHTWHTMALDIPSHDLFAVVQFPDRDKRNAERGAAKVLTSITPVSVPPGATESSRN